MAGTGDFVVPIKMREFGRSELERFTRVLNEDDEALAFEKVEKLEQVLFSAKGLLQGRYRLNTVGAAQFFAEVCPGFYGTVRALLRDEHPDIPQKNAVKLVCLLSNKIAQHRFPAVEGCRVVLDNAKNEVEGFVGRSYVLVKNSTVFSQFSQTCEVIRGNPKFYGSQLHGRDMLSTFAVPSPINEGSTGPRFFNGVVVQNRETAGRAIRAANALFDTHTRSWSADQFYPDTRVPHVKGKRFRDRMFRMADSLAARQPKAADIVEGFRAASIKRLGNKMDDDLRAKLRKYLIRQAEQQHVAAQTVDYVLDEMQERHRAGPTLFDLYTSCLRVAAQTRLGNSLPVRQLAYAIVMRGN